MPEFGLIRVTTPDRRRNYFIVMDRADSKSDGSGAHPGVGGLPLTVLGDYTLLREIGRGGMGVVYEARQASLDRSVAVKVLGQQVSASPKAVLRFRREAQAAAKLHHAHIVPIFGLGETDGIYYYAMEFIDGCGLNAIIKPETPSVPSATTDIDPAETVLLERSRGPAASAVSSSGATESSSAASPVGEPKGARVEVQSRKKHYEMVAMHIASIADALDYAHREGVIHRDVKPHNLIMGKDGKLRIADFGLARLVEQPGVTVTGEMIGSPLYMSPEQVTAVSSEVDHRTDIYSLGATLYEWLTGSPPYPGDTRERVISRILTTEPMTLRAHNEDIPLDLETVCLKAIERDPQRRYQTGGALRDDLQRFIENRPIRARRASLGTRLRKFVGRHQLASLGAVAAVVALSLSAALFNSKRDTKTQTEVATKAQEETDKILEAFSSLVQTEGLASLLPVELTAPFRMARAALPMLQSVVDPSSQNSGAAPASHAASASTTASIARRAARDFYVATTGPDAWITLGGGSDACSAVVKRIDDLWSMDGDAAMTLVEACLASRPDFMAIGELRAALCGWFGRPQAMKAAADELALRHPNAPRIYAWRGLARTLADGGEAGIADLAQAIETDPKSVWAQTLSGLAMAWTRRSFEAISRFDDALEMDPDLVVALLGRALVRADLGNYSGAVSDLDRVIDAEPENVHALVSRGDQEVNNGDFEAAVRDYDQAIVVGGRTPALSLRSLLARTRLRDAIKGDSPQPSIPQRSDAETPRSETGDAGWNQRRLEADPLETNTFDTKRGYSLRPFSMRWGSWR